MASIVVEQEFRRPRSREDILDLIANSAPCLGLYDATDVAHYFSTDGSRLTCVFEAPDAEAMRNVMKAPKNDDPPAIWAASVHPASQTGIDILPKLSDPKNAMAVVERSFAERVRFEDVDEAEKRNLHCLELHRVRFLVSYFSADKRRMLCLYEAPDVEAVRTANRTAGLPFDVVWGANVIVP